jgi:hypothetical protein
MTTLCNVEEFFLKKDLSLWRANGEGFIAFSLCGECKAIRAQTMVD